jgi:phosphate transport system substrate-binding protein
VKKSILMLACALVASSAGAQNLNGAGATFPAPIYQKWFSEYSASHKGVEINYQPIGSGGGIRQVLAGTVDFGATDGPMSDEQMNSATIKVFHVPTVLGAVVPIYNIPGVGDDLKFSPDVLADIYLGKIAKWPRTIPASSCPIRASSRCIVPMAAVPLTSLPTISPR